MAIRYDKKLTNEINRVVRNFNNKMRISVEQLAALVHGTVEGDATAFIDNYSKIEEATEGCLTFLANPKYTHIASAYAVAPVPPLASGI